MKSITALVCALLMLLPPQARGDFKYTDTAKITGGTLKNMMKTVGFFSKQVRHGRQAVPAVGLAFSRFGGGYVDQKCRPHFGHTQN